VETTILNLEIQDFIEKSLEMDVSKIALQKNPFPTLDWKEIINQIAAKQKAKDKLPTWFKTKNIVYPTKISVEQTSSEKTAEYKANLVFGNSLIDLSGGFGVDTFYFSKKTKQVIHCEINPALSGIVSHNFKQLQAKNIQCLTGDSEQILKNSNKNFDWIYIDPSRRNENKGKVFMLKDCLPNVPQLLDLYYNYSSAIIIKTAPILDLTAGISELKNVKEIHVLAVQNEVKELIWILEKEYQKPIQIKTCNLLKVGQENFEAPFLETELEVVYGAPKKYLYEPNAAIMKSGLFNAIAIKFCIEKLHKNSHLYTSEIVIDFPGRIFEIENIIPYQKSEMKFLLENNKANVTVRNFPDSVENIRKKWKIKEGGSLYCFFTTDLNDNKIVLLCSKLK
jgi:hypothetical protein